MPGLNKVVATGVVLTGSTPQGTCAISNQAAAPPRETAAATSATAAGGRCRACPWGWTPTGAWTPPPPPGPGPVLISEMVRSGRVLSRGRWVGRGLCLALMLLLEVAVVFVSPARSHVSYATSRSWTRNRTPLLLCEMGAKRPLFSVLSLALARARGRGGLAVLGNAAMWRVALFLFCVLCM